MWGIEGHAPSAGHTYGVVCSEHEPFGQSYAHEWGARRNVSRSTPPAPDEDEDEVLAPPVPVGKMSSSTTQPAASPAARSRDGARRGSTPTRDRESPARPSKDILRPGGVDLGPQPGNKEGAPRVMETLLTWIHLSDLCLGPVPPGTDSTSSGPHAHMIAALRQDILERAGLPPGAADALVVTGDVTARGSRDECAAARKWLLDLGRALGLGPERTFLVAGNHDVDRVAAARNEGLELRLLAELREGRRRLDAALDKANARAVLAARLAPFAELGASFGTRSTDQRLEWSHRIEGRGGLRVRLVGLCTSWLSLDTSDRGKLCLGGGPLARAESAIGAGELVVVLTHHPLRGGWLADEHDADAWMRANAHVHLTGHVHDAAAESARAGAPGPCVWIAAGASSPEAPAGPLGWSLASVVRAPDGALAVRVAPRRWSGNHKRFVSDEEALRDRRAFAEHALRLRLAPAVAGAASHPPPAPLRDSVPPAAREAAHHGVFEGPGALPASPVPAFVGRDANLAALRAMLAEPGVTCVVATGPSGVGKTALVQHFVAAEARARFDEGVWIDARDLRAEIGRIAKRLGFKGDDRSFSEVGGFVRRALETRRVLLVVDNVDPGTASIRAIPVPPDGSRSRLVVVSRIVTLHEDLGRLARPLRLGTWDAAAGRAFLREAVPERKDEPDADLDLLGARVGGLPLAMRLLARQLGRPGMTARVLDEMLARAPLAMLDAAARGSERTLSATFQAAVDGLGEAEQGVLLALAACAPATRAEVVAAVAGVRADEAALALEGLSEQSLVDWQPEADDPFGSTRWRGWRSARCRGRRRPRRPTRRG